MEWSEDFIKVDKELYKVVVQEKNLEKLYKMFPHTRNLVEYSNVIPPYPYRRDSILSLLVKAEDSAFVERLLTRYFEPQTPKKLKFLTEFLKGTNELGQKMNFHYFYEDFPPDEKARKELFLEDDKDESEIINFKIDNKLYKDNRTKSQKNRYEIYKIVRNLSLMVRHTDSNQVPEKENICRKDGGLIKQIKGKNFVWNKDYTPLGNFLIRNGIGKGELWEYMKGLDYHSSENYRQQFIDKNDFPEVFWWAKDSLKSVEYAIKSNENNENIKDMVYNFEVNNGFIILENEKHLYANSLRPERAIAFHSVLQNDGRSIIGFYNNFARETNDTKQATLPHELMHAMEAKGEKFANTDILKAAFMVMTVENFIYDKNKDITEMINKILFDYKKKAYTDELAAMLLEKKNDRDNTLLYKMQKLACIYNHAKINDKKGMLKYIDTIMIRNSSQDKLNKAYKAFENFLELSVPYLKNASISEDKLDKKREIFVVAYRELWGCGNVSKKLNKILDKELGNLKKLSSSYSSIKWYQLSRYI